MPLARRYKMDRVFQNKRITGMWATDTVYGRVNYLDGNLYAKVWEMVVELV